jgi:hypothetical protein
VAWIVNPRALENNVGKRKLTMLKEAGPQDHVYRFEK